MTYLYINTNTEMMIKTKTKIIPLKEIGKREHENATDNVSVSYVDMRIHSMVE